MSESALKFPEQVTSQVIRTDIKVLNLIDAIAQFQGREGWSPRRISETFSYYYHAFPPLTEALRLEGLIGQDDYVGVSGRNFSATEKDERLEHEILIANIPGGISLTPQLLLWNHPALFVGYQKIVGNPNMDKDPINHKTAWFRARDNRGVDYNLSDGGRPERSVQESRYYGHISHSGGLKQDFSVERGENGKFVLQRLSPAEEHESKGIRLMYFRLRPNGDTVELLAWDKYPYDKIKLKEMTAVGEPQTVSRLRLDERAAHLLPLDRAVERDFPNFEIGGTKANAFLVIQNNPISYQATVQFYKLTNPRHDPSRLSTIR